MTAPTAPPTSPAHLDFALAYQLGHIDGICWEVFPLATREKIPALSAHPQGDPLRGVCKGGCGRDGHGVLDATRDPSKASEWWSAGPRRNIGGRVPEALFVLDIDPRHNGLTNLLQLITDHGGEWHRTRKGLTGGGGYHLLFPHPGGKIGQGRLPDGVEVKTYAGYIVLPPSVHPSGHAYRWEDVSRPIVPAVPWLIELLRPAEPAPAPPPRRLTGSALWRSLSTSTDSVADWYCQAHRWADVLIGWTLVAGDGESDGSAWRHPTATSKSSATVSNDGLLFCYSPSTPLPQTLPGEPRGQTKFRAWACLEHHGDLSAAARAARVLKNRRAA